MSTEDIKKEIIKIMDGRIKYKCQEPRIPNLALVVISEEEYSKLYEYLHKYKWQRGIDLGVYDKDDEDDEDYCPLYNPCHWETESDGISYGYSGISAISQKDRETISDMGYIVKLKEEEYDAGYDWDKFFKNKEAIMMDISFLYKI